MPAHNITPRTGSAQQLPPLVSARVNGGWTLVGCYTYQYPGGQDAFHRALLHPPALPPNARGAAPLQPEWHSFHSLAGSWRLGEPAPRNRVLYRLPRLLSAPIRTPVYLTPDERAADRLAGLGLVATTPGAGLAPAGTDWSVLRTRSLRLWPQQGPLGAGWLQQLAELLRPHRCTLYVPHTWGWGQHQDALDWLAATPQACGRDIETMSWKPWPQAGAAAAAPPAPELRLLTVCAADLAPQALQWLWPGRIALGKLSLLAGSPGLGKSLLSLSLAAHVSRGLPWPVDGTSCPLGEVLLVTEEDGAADTIRPRLDAAGADSGRVHLLRAVQRDGKGSRTLRLQHDLKALESFLAARPQVRLVCIDPLSLYLGESGSAGEAAVRAILHPLAELAARAGAAVVGVAHLNKRNLGADGSHLQRIAGSLALAAAARACHLVQRDPCDHDRRLFLPVKNNLGQDTQGLAYRVVAPDGAPRVQWEDQPVPLNAPEADAEEQSEAADAATWLRDLLGPASLGARQVRKAAAEAGYPWRTVQHARRRAGVESRRIGFGADAIYLWSLRTSPPEAAPEHPPGAEAAR